MTNEAKNLYVYVTGTQPFKGYIEKVKAADSKGYGLAKAEIRSVVMKADKQYSKEHYTFEQSNHSMQNIDAVIIKILCDMYDFM